MSVQGSASAVPRRGADARLTVVAPAMGLAPVSSAARSRPEHRSALVLPWLPVVAGTIGALVLAVVRIEHHQFVRAAWEPAVVVWLGLLTVGVSSDILRLASQLRVPRRGVSVRGVKEFDQPVS